MKRNKFLRNILLGGAVLSLAPGTLFGKEKGYVPKEHDLLFSENFSESFLVIAVDNEGKFKGYYNRSWLTTNYIPFKPKHIIECKTVVEILENTKLHKNPEIIKTFL